MKRKLNDAAAPRRHFDEAFKLEALALWKSSGKSGEQIAHELGIRPDMLYRWKQGGAGSGSLAIA